MPTLPNPFCSDGSRAPSEAAAASPVSSQADAAAELYGIGPCIINDLPIIRVENDRTRHMIVEHEADHRFVLDEEAFLNDIEPLPAFLGAPSQEYLRATEIMPVLEVLAGH